MIDLWESVFSKMCVHLLKTTRMFFSGTVFDAGEHHPGFTTHG
ncbi:MAG: hypothetical protein JWM11_3110 [Planctomycetaceae bacterium]|nr:hypothetical protein [Planctomycetaceae bacterium]